MQQWPCVDGWAILTAENRSQQSPLCPKATGGGRKICPPVVSRCILHYTSAFIVRECLAFYSAKRLRQWRSPASPLFTRQGVPSHAPSTCPAFVVRPEGVVPVAEHSWPAPVGSGVTSSGALADLGGSGRAHSQNGCRRIPQRDLACLVAHFSLVPDGHLSAQAQPDRRRWSV